MLCKFGYIIFVSCLILIMLYDFSSCRHRRDSKLDFDSLLGHLPILCVHYDIADVLQDHLLLNKTFFLSIHWVIGEEYLILGS